MRKEAGANRSMPLYDTHCHLQDARFVDGADALIARARDAGVNLLLCCGTSEADWPQVAAIARAHGEVTAAFGLHPWYAEARSANWIDSLRSLLADDPGAAVGEIGLDHALDRTTFAAQEEVLIAQLRLARELDRPVSVHCRRAWDRLLAIAAHVGLPRRGGVVHSFSGSPELVPALQDLGFSISFSGSLTYDRNKRGVRSCAAVAADRLLVETDAPDLTPVGASGNPRVDRTAQADRERAGVNEPANLPLVVEAAARVRGMSVAAAAELTWGNAVRVFGASGRSDGVLPVPSAEPPADR